MAKSYDYDDFILKVGLNVPGDMPWFGDPNKVQGDRATIVFEDNSELPCRKVGGVWKLDITPPKPQTPAGAAGLLEHDIKVLDQLTANVLAGRYKTLIDVQNALLAAKLSGKSGNGQ